jgi:hypothetical protein
LTSHPWKDEDKHIMLRYCLVGVAIVAATAAGIAVAGTAQKAAPACGVERWSVKTLQAKSGAFEERGETPIPRVPPPED